jgi:hypothetical protein
MALSVAGLKAALIAALGPAEDGATQDDVAQALAEAIVDYFVANAVITVPGVQAGGATVVGTLS